MPYKDREEGLRKKREAYRRKMADPEYRERVDARQRESRRRRAARNRALVAEFKGAGCAVCGESDARCVGPHHRDPGTKSFNISLGMSRGISEKAMRAELAKCDVLCANHHKAVHAGGGGVPYRQEEWAKRALEFLDED